MRIALFATCVVDTLYPDVGRCTVELLERLGHELVFPEEQTCCGQLHANAGFDREAARLAARFVRVFDGADLVVSPSASCTAAVRHHYRRLARGVADVTLTAELEAVGSRVLELSELLVDRLGAEDVGAVFPHRVVYHPTCHSLRMLRVGDRPLRLLRAVRGMELVDLTDAEECCGFGGVFAVKNVDTSAAMLTDKLSHVVDSGAEFCVAADSSCLMQIGGGLRRGRAGIQPLHLAQVLAAGA